MSDRKDKGLPIGLVVVGTCKKITSASTRGVVNILLVIGNIIIVLYSLYIIRGKFPLLDSAFDQVLHELVVQFLIFLVTGTLMFWLGKKLLRVQTMQVQNELKYKLRRFGHWLFTFVFVGTSLLSGLGYNYAGQIANDVCFGLTNVPAADLEQGEILLLISPFEQQHGTKLEPHKEWVESLNLAKDLADQDGFAYLNNVRIELINRVARNKEEAVAFADCYQATMIIWGSVGTEKVVAHYTPIQRDLTLAGYSDIWFDWDEFTGLGITMVYSDSLPSGDASTFVQSRTGGDSLYAMYFVLSQLYLQAWDIETAGYYIDRAIEIIPNSPEIDTETIYYYNGLSLISRNEYEAAIVSFILAGEKYLSGLGYAQYLHGDYAATIDTLLQIPATELLPSDARVISESYLKLGEYNMAIKYAEKVYTLSGLEPNPIHPFGQISIESDDRMIKFLFSEVMMLAHTDRILATANYRLGNTQTAIEWINSAIFRPLVFTLIVEPKGTYSSEYSYSMSFLGNANYFLGSMYLLEGEGSLALMYFEEALEYLEYGENPTLYLSLAELHQKLGNTELAIQNYEIYVSLTDDHRYDDSIEELRPR